MLGMNEALFEQQKRLNAEAVLKAGKAVGLGIGGSALMAAGLAADGYGLMNNEPAFILGGVSAFTGGFMTIYYAGKRIAEALTLHQQAQASGLLGVMQTVQIEFGPPSHPESHPPTTP